MRINSSIRSPLFAVVLLAISAAAYTQIGISISFAPPELPVYEQPLCPGDGYLWTPGYWAYAEDDYYWVPGTWVMAPEPGLLWTPAYWGWGGSGFVFYDGYWGQQVGFYGGVSYGYGYFGEGFQGGRWEGEHFYYNRAASNVNVTEIHNVYNTTVVNNTSVRVSYNGGNGGISARPTDREERVAHERHVSPVAAQTQHAQEARAKPEMRASVNHGAPAVAATPKPGAFSDHAVVPAKQGGTPYNRAAVQPPANSPAAQPKNGSARPEQPAPNSRPEANRAEPNRPATAQPNDRPEPNRPATTQPNNRPEPNRPPTAQPNNRAEPNRNEPAQRSQTPPSTERTQPQHAPAPAETRPTPQQQQHAPAAKPEEKKQQKEQPKQEEKRPQ
jgi:WXXGXW repeat (2 copies)